MSQLFYLLIFFVNLLNVHGSSECSIKICDGTSTEKHFKEFEQYCKDSLIEGRCCNSTRGIIGLDLSNCSLKTLNDVLTNFSGLEYLDLSDNPIQNCSKEYFKGLVNLTLLYLPSKCECPGNVSAWNDTEEGNYCKGQNATCDVYCSENGQCIHDGPGLAICQCLPGYYSYRCMREVGTSFIFY
ncbi:all-trans retinoic acid-induced differentiation factor-like isoform X1 [Centruroides sculpturatus]|uniref:all-trans retinoic acid-induced differentiation factor-like isoform X1 n=1 Tax=Centruroides sculpturatus TaxID=218467 RepID=UPI000C6EB964|nr:all-trans retinoic acid-induced differentiation factor-like isoform X1 [Centruroides sculpturatus]